MRHGKTTVPVLAVHSHGKHAKSDPIQAFGSHHLPPTKHSTAGGKNGQQKTLARVGQLLLKNSAFQTQPPKGVIDSVALAASLKRYSDTELTSTASLRF